MAGLGFHHVGPVRRDSRLDPRRGDDGAHTFRLDAGRYHIRVVREGWTPRELEFEIEEGRTVHRSVHWEEER